MALEPDPHGCAIHPLALFLGCLLGAAAFLSFFPALVALLRVTMR